ncbi:1-aminocyclopropane-1-carboxylate oxidase-like 1, partial [Mucuna pruriens]
MGTTTHFDPDFLTILLQDHIGGLHVLSHNHWVDVPPVPGPLVVYIGDLLQVKFILFFFSFCYLVNENTIGVVQGLPHSNERFKSVVYHVLSNRKGPRVPVACFFTLHLYPTRMYGSIKELLSEDNPPYTTMALVTSVGTSTNSERLRQLKAFDESKAGVKGLVDSGITHVPPIFLRPPEDLAADSPVSGEPHFAIPVVDLAEERAGVVAGVRRAAKMVGLFQVVNHGISAKVVEEMAAAAREFHEMAQEVKGEYYTREKEKRVKYGSNFDLYRSKYANWRDTLFCAMAPQPFHPQQLPLLCRDITMEYSRQVQVLGGLLFALLSEALGLNSDHLESMDCAKGHSILMHYYPACPEPHLTLGTNRHSDPGFLTVLLQDHIGGLQVLYQNEWIDVPPIPGALVVNIGDMLQLISNDQFKSVEHRVVASHKGPRVSVACFFTLDNYPSARMYGPIKELLSEDNPPVYRETSLQDFNHTTTMDVAGAGKSFAGRSPNYDRLQELKAFDESKAGVKGLVDAGITKVPQIFLRPPEDIAADELISGERTPTQFRIPVIDLKDVAGHRSGKVAEVRRAAETVGFFQVVNHGVPVKVLEDMVAVAREFHELALELKVEYYSRDMSEKKVKYRSNFDLYQSKYVNWRDTLKCVMAPEPLDPQELPPVCRDVMLEFSKHVEILGSLLFELLSEALGLKPCHLKDMDCTKGHLLLCHYYPKCPEPELTLGTSKHSDPDFLTILLQDHIGGLQVLYQNQWVDVPPIPGALVVNIGDVLQLISNDKFKSVEHRVLANQRGPRVSVACFFTLDHCPSTRIYGPIKELLSEDKPPLYREILLQDFNAYYNNKGLDGNSALAHFKLFR